MAAIWVIFDTQGLLLLSPLLLLLLLLLLCSTDCEKPYVTMNDKGRLGNMICQYASLYLLRHLHGIRVCSTLSLSLSLSQTQR